MHISYKYKKFWYFIIKLSLVFGVGYFIYQRVFENSKLPITALLKQTKANLLQENWVIPVLLVFTLINWLLEITKWQTLVNSLENISFLTATKQSLASHTLSIITPFKSGEYVGKSLYFSKGKRKKIFLLKLIGNLAQLLATAVFGIAGLVFFFTYFDIPIQLYKLRRFAYIVALLIAAVFMGRNGINKKGGYYEKAFIFLKEITVKTKLKVTLLSFLRYLVFSHQFYFLLLLFGIEIDYFTALFLIFSMYFIATMLPVISLFDFVIKGGIGIYLFTFVGVGEVVILTISMLMWLLNFVLPAIIGVYFVIVYKPNLEK